MPMILRGSGLSALLWAALLLAPCCVKAQSATVPADVAVSKARARYYTPVDSGLGSFRCDVQFDWKDFLEKATHQAVPDNDPRLAYLRSIRLSVEDTLRGTGELHWTAPTTAPDASEDSVNKIREGMEQIWSGFFQSWNGFMTGDLVSLDTNATAERTPAGFHVAVRTGPQVAEEFFNADLLLQTVHVATPSIESTLLPTFTATPRGLRVSEINSSFRQPPTAEPTEVSMHVQYAPVSSFDLPSELVVAVGPAHFDFHLTGCTTQSTVSPGK